MTVAWSQKRVLSLCLWTVKVIWLCERCLNLWHLNLCQFVSQVRVFTDQTVGSDSDGSAACSWVALAYWPRQPCLQYQQMPQYFHMVRLGVLGLGGKALAQEIRTCQHWFMSKKTILSFSLMSLCVCETVSRLLTHSLKLMFNHCFHTANAQQWTVRYYLSLHKKVFAHIDSVFCLLPLNVSIIKHILISIDNLSK